MHRRLVVVLFSIIACTEPGSREPVGMFRLESMDGKNLPVTLSSGVDSLISGEMVLRSDSIFGFYSRYRGPLSGQRLSPVVGRWSIAGNTVTYRNTNGMVVGTGTLYPGGVTYVVSPGASTYAFSHETIDDPAVLSDRGSFSITATGALSGTTTATDTSHFLVGLGDFVFVYNDFFIMAGKQSSVLGPADTRDLGTIMLNPNIPGPGTYTNNGCPSRAGFGTKCVAINYLVGLPIATSTPHGTLVALADDRVSVVVDALSFWHIKLSMSGPFEWLPTMPPGVAQRRDTVTVSASFNAFRVR